MNRNQRIDANADNDGGVKCRQPNPMLRANFFSKILFWWLRDLFVKGMRGQITMDEIYATKEALHSATITAGMSERWQRELQQPDTSLLRMLINGYGWPVILWGLMFMLAETASRIAQPLCLGGLVSYFVPGQTDISKTDAYLYCAGIVVTSATIVVTFHPFYMWLSEKSGIIRLGCSGLMYAKVLRMPRAALGDGLNGRLINLLSNDVARFELALLFIHDVWKGPSETILFTYFIYREIGIAAVIGIGFLLCFIPLQAWVGRRAALLRLKTAKRTDFRVKIMNEIIQGIQVIKMYAWENSFAQMVDRIRRKEIVAVRQTAYVRATLTALGMISRLSIFISLLSYIFMGNVITARQVFIVSSYFGILNFSMLFHWTYAITCVAEGYISVKRIQEFLLMCEEKPAHILDVDTDNGANEKFRKNIVQQSNSLSNGTAKSAPPQRRIQNESAAVKQISLDGVVARWTGGDDGTVGIRDITLRIEAGELCTVIGQVGAGKSTLLQALLGELDADGGRMRIDGSLSYAPQEAWLFEGSIRANIVFIEEFDEHRYREVVRVCALERDFVLLPNGDETVVGERGISLSGGQKARVNLARAVYKRADIYLLDDPLSAVDTHVGKHMFEECIRGFLGDKICVLVTHQLQHLQQAKRVIVLNRGRLEAQGTYAELKEQNIEALMSTPDESGLHAAEEQQKRKRAAAAAERKRSVSSSTVSFVEDDEVAANAEQADRIEHSSEGSVNWDVYGQFLKAVNNRFYVFALAAMFVTAQVAVSGVDFFVTVWVNWEESLVTQRVSESLTVFMFGAEGTTDDEHRQHYIIGYCVLMALATYVFVHRTFAFFALCLRATTNLHDQLFRGISRAKMFFYNTNPSGRILNRFSKDIGNIDVLLPPALMDSLSAICECIAILAIVVSVNYWLLIPTIMLLVMIYGIRQCYIKTARTVKRIESVSLSPIYSHTNATLQGLSTVRAFRADAILQAEFYRHLDRNTGDWYCRIATTRAFAFWLDTVCLLYVGTVTVSFVAFDRGDTQSGNVGLAILNCINLIGMCQWGIRQTAEVENQMTSVERLMEYANLPAEAALETATADKPPADWPQSGAIHFDALSFRYTPDGAFVLRDLQLSVAAQEKVGIVGRTGAGKSSLIQALFRLADLDGRIIIDGVDTNRLGLHELRRNISIIPQDPVLFSGTLRFNLDPFAERSDEELWRSLDQVELRAFVADQVGALDCRMQDGGSNFSVGQRQLVCLARAILRNNRILILDEATANVDPETDRLIQTTIRQRFGGCTVLTIAHRLHTVMDSDRVLVVDAGRAMEFGHPHELLQQDGGYLQQLVDQTGVETAAILAAIAAESYMSKSKTA